MNSAGHLFSSGVAENALGSGPYNYVSSENLSEKDQRPIYGESNHNKTKHKQHKTSDPQIPQPDLRFAAKSAAKQQRNGAGPNKNTHKDGLP